jgi:hypothetical protein
LGNNLLCCVGDSGRMRCCFVVGVHLHDDAVRLCSVVIL